MFIVTGYLVEVGNNFKEQPSMTFDVGGDRMLTVDCVSKEDCQAVGHCLGKLICVAWGGAEMHVVEAGEGVTWEDMSAGMRGMVAGNGSQP